MKNLNLLIVTALCASLAIPFTASALSVDAEVDLDADGSLMTNSSDTKAQTEVGANVRAKSQHRLDNLNHLRLLKERRAAWKNSSGDENSTTTPKMMKAEFLSTLKERRESVAEHKAELKAEKREKASLSAETQLRVENFANGLFDSFERALARLDNIVDRIAAKIEQLENSGHDLSAETEMLANAELSLEAADTEVAEAKLALEVMLSSETPREELTTVKEALKEAKTALRTTRQELMDVVKSIKVKLAGEAEANVEAETN